MSLLIAALLRYQLALQTYTRTGGKSRSCPFVAIFQHRTRQDSLQARVIRTVIDIDEADVLQRADRADPPVDLDDFIIDAAVP